jgi:hypothetical protein
MYNTKIDKNSLDFLKTAVCKKNVVKYWQSVTICLNSFSVSMIILQHFFEVETSGL